jgi:hypothetical protein
MGEIKMAEQKKFKIKIRIIADYYKDGNGNATKSFSDAVQDWYLNIGMPSLLNELNKGDLLDKSYLNNFRTSPDSVDKEAYD